MEFNSQDSRTYCIQNFESLSIKVRLRLFKIFRKAKRKTSNFSTYLEFQCSSILGENLETKLKDNVVTDVISLTFALYFVNIWSYKSRNEVILVAFESLLKDIQLLFLPLRANSNYIERYKVWNLTVQFCPVPKRELGYLT